MQFFALLSAATAIFGTTLALPSNKPTGGPASAQVTIYSGPYTCSDPNTPPTANSAGTAKVVSVAENQCVITNIPFGGALTASLTATPKTGTTGCYIQIFTQAGCGVTLQNQYHGFPFNGVTLNSAMGCASAPVQSYGGLEIVCV